MRSLEVSAFGSRHETPQTFEKACKSAILPQQINVMTLQSVDQVNPQGSADALTREPVPQLGCRIVGEMVVGGRMLFGVSIFGPGGMQVGTLMTTVVTTCLAYLDVPGAFELLLSFR